MNKVIHTIFRNLSRILLTVAILAVFSLFAPHSYAAGWTSLGLSNQSLLTIAVDPNNSSTLYAGGAGVFKSTDGGANWTSINNGLPSGAGVEEIVIDPTNSNILYAGIPGPSAPIGIFKSTDGGANWTNISNNITTPSAYAIAIDPNNHNTLWVGIGGGSGCGLWKSTNGGSSWLNTQPPHCDIGGVSIDPTNSNVVYADSDGVYTWKSTDGGITWSQGGPSITGGGAQKTAIDLSNTNILYSGIGQDSPSDGIWKSTDGANSWTQIYSETINGYLCGFQKNFGIDPVHPTNIYIKGNYSGSYIPCPVYHSSDGGTTWTNITDNLPSSTHINRFVIPTNNPNILYAATDVGIYTYNIQSLDQGPSFTLSNANINPGDTYSASGSFTDTDPNATSWTATVNYGDGSGTQPLTLSGTNFSLSHQYNTIGGYTVVVSITNNLGEVGVGIASVTVNDALPIVGTITAPSSPVLVNTAITASANFTDANATDTHTASWNWGDGNITTGTVTESNGSGSVSDSHTYTATGVYTITLTVTDNHGGQGASTFQYVAVYDSNTSFAGGRSFDNPASASPNTTGKVSFGISAKYNNSNVLTGNAKMDFKAASLDFASTSLSSLATSNGKAYLKGSGTLNGNSGYTFLATGIDGSVVGGNDLIRFQIKDASNNVVYDSQQGAGDTTDPTTVDATGNIRVH